METVALPELLPRANLCRMRLGQLKVGGRLKLLRRWLKSPARCAKLGLTHGLRLCPNGLQERREVAPRLPVRCGAEVMPPSLFEEQAGAKLIERVGQLSLLGVAIRGRIRYVGALVSVMSPPGKTTSSVIGTSCAALAASARCTCYTPPQLPPPSRHR